jgi:VWFA-related protein
MQYDLKVRFDHRGRPLWILALLALILLRQIGLSQTIRGFDGSPSSQSQNSGQSPLPQPAVRVTTRMVQVTVVVHDRDGNPVTGLSKDDFKIFDEGEPQDIAKFSEQNNHVTSTVAARPPNSLSNRIQPLGVARRLVIVVLDIRMSAYLDYVICLQSANPLPECGAVARTFQAGQRFLSTIEPQDRVALYEFADKLYLLHDFTSDQDELLRALEKGKEYKDNIHFAVSQMRAVDIASQTTGAMRAIAERVSSLPGRKSVVWLSLGFPYMRGLNDGDIQRAVRSLNNADAPLYALDAKSLVAPEPWATIGQVPGDTGATGPNRPTPTPSNRPSGGGMGSPQSSDMFEWFHTLGSVALGSGGKVFENTNDLSGAMDRAIDDSRATYVLGYYPTHDKWNGSFHAIKVEVDRPGLEVRSRKGYYATPDSAQPTTSVVRRVADAVQSPLESTDLGFDVTVDAFNGPGGHQLKVNILVDASQVHFTRQGDRWTDALEIVWAKADELGRRTIFKSETLSLKPKEDTYRGLLQNGLSFTQIVEVPADAESLRIVLRDIGSNVIGSVDIPRSQLLRPRAQ